ncbi:putative FAD-linked oxidoreductase [Maioricimonas rarisocia]|uniref:Putative FAD-linked oxidoreductase n=1 Tax=Maioricimonas rarisocia TaxID=2528026 RepID=A0A517Z6I6_9PLAN|nr:FAD-binding oxidoreductase [Maioricimonas rarisocia]QDU38098.1 putative FAD-linked oxidoreductase [Maioricimonas rarisocia]
MSADPIESFSRHIAGEFAPTSAAELSRFVGENSHGDRQALYPVGGRTALHYGDPPLRDGVFVATSELARVVDFAARDMTVTVEAGIRIDELKQLLAKEGQRLPIDIPQGHRATLGGALASNTSGPGRFGYGTFRDYVIGISAVDGQGRLFSAGGRVVKNVAGYDLCKLLIGSLGTLAIVTQVTLKTRPLAASRGLLWLTFDQADTVEEALQHLLVSRTRPVSVEVLNQKAAWQIVRDANVDLSVGPYVLCLGYEGSDRETRWQLETAASELASLPDSQQQPVPRQHGDQLWSALTEYQASSDDPLTFQTSLPRSHTLKFIEHASNENVAVQAHAGNGIVIGHLPDSCSSAESAAAILAPLRTLAEAADGSLTVLSCDEAWKQTLSVFGSAPPSWNLMRRLKQALDPDGVLNAGRFRFPED